jgi:hypothetical protein
LFFLKKKKRKKKEKKVYDPRPGLGNGSANPRPATTCVLFFLKEKKLKRGILEIIHLRDITENFMGTVTL